MHRDQNAFWPKKVDRAKRPSSQGAHTKGKHFQSSDSADATTNCHPSASPHDTALTPGRRTSTQVFFSDSLPPRSRRDPRDTASLTPPSDYSPKSFRNPFRLGIRNVRRLDNRSRGVRPGGSARRETRRQQTRPPRAHHRTRKRQCRRASVGKGTDGLPLNELRDASYPSPMRAEKRSVTIPTIPPFRLSAKRIPTLIP